MDDACRRQWTAWFSSALYILEKGEGEQNIYLILISNINVWHNIYLPPLRTFTDFYQNAFKKYSFVIKQIVYCRYWQNDRTACLFPISFNWPGVQVYTRQKADRWSGERSGAALESGVHPAPCPLSCPVQLKDYKADQEKDQVLTQNQVLTRNRVLPPAVHLVPCPVLSN